MMKDPLGYASIKDLRIQLGLSLEEFMRKFRDYILEHYELVSSSDEGIIQGIKCNYLSFTIHSI